jgi:hypothetical protein
MMPKAAETQVQSNAVTSPVSPTLCIINAIQNRNSINQIVYLTRFKAISVTYLCPYPKLRFIMLYLIVVISFPILRYLCFNLYKKRLIKT